MIQDKVSARDAVAVGIVRHALYPCPLCGSRAMHLHDNGIAATCEACRVVVLEDGKTTIPYDEGAKPT